jgi:hypothetical protein
MLRHRPLLKLVEPSDQMIHLEDSMRLKSLMRVLAILFVATLASGTARAQAQDHQHVVSLGELTKDSAGASETRNANEAAVRHLLSSEEGQRALQSAKIDYAKVDKAVGQLSDEDVAKLADRSRSVEKDFAAGSLSDRDLLVIVIIAVLIIALIAALH